MEEIDLDQIRAHLAQLSEPGNVPDLVGGPPKPTYLDAANIDFETNSWLGHLADAQIWLNLDSPLDTGHAPERVATALFDQVWPGSNGGAFAIDGQGVVRLTELGAQHLEERLSRAATFRETFASALEEERTLHEATQDWLAAWEEPIPDQPLNINAAVDRWRISEFAARADANELDLNPPYQRDFVWSNSDSQTLIESILRGIPLPSIILARGTGNETYQIVDGKQRLTAILRFMGRHPEGVAFARGAKEPEQFHKNMGAFARKNTLTANDLRKHYLPFKTKKYPSTDPLSSLSGKYYSAIKNEKVRIAGEMVTVEKLFESGASSYLIPILEYKNTPVRDIHKVFRIYNQQGMKLNAEEIRNAVYNHLDIARMMLFIGGDRPDPALVMFMPEMVGDFGDMRDAIEALGFGIVRFKRTKVLLWVTATLLQPSGEPGAYRTPSTATHIDNFLDRIDDGKSALKDTRTLKQLAADLAAAVALHAEVDDAWHPRFRRKGKSEMASKWEELPVVGSLCACLVLTMLGEADRLRNAIPKIRELTSRKPGPESTQNRTQWAHIADITIDVLNALEIDLAVADAAVAVRYQSSAIKGLIELQKLQDFNQ